MINMNKQYTYNGKPVRIYADGSDTCGNQVHIGYCIDNENWMATTCRESDLVETWEPKEGDWCWIYTTADDGSPRDYHLSKFIGLQNGKYCFTLDGRVSYENYRNIEPFNGELPEAFKGLV